MELEKITQKPVRRNLLQEFDESEVTRKPNLRSFLKRTQSSRYTPIDIFESSGKKYIESDKTENSTNKVSNRKRCMELANDPIELSSEDEDKTPIQKIRKVDRSIEKSKSITPPTLYKKSKVDFHDSGVKTNEIQEYNTLNNGLGNKSPQIDEIVHILSKSATTENKDAENEVKGNQEIQELLEKLEQDLSEMKKTIEKMKTIYKK